MIIDDREHDLIARLTAEKQSFEIRRLPVGDIMFQHNGTTAIVERKRTDDFAASISDSRWREQKARLAASGAIVIYLIEGSLYGQSKSPETLSSAIWNTMLRDQMFVIQTRGIEETSLHLQQLEKKIGMDIKSSSSMVSLLSKRKRKVDNAWLLMLMAIPSVSERIAAVLVAEYPRLTSLQRQLTQNPDHLRSLKVTEKRKIGKKTIENLKQYLI
jgi:ERCC4-type nuclease